MEIYNKLVKDMYDNIEETVQNQDYFEEVGYKEIKEKHGEALAALLTDIHKSLTSAALVYVASKMLKQ